MVAYLHFLLLDGLAFNDVHLVNAVDILEGLRRDKKRAFHLFRRNIRLHEKARLQQPLTIGDQRFHLEGARLRVHGRVDAP